MTREMSFRQELRRCISTQL